MTESIKISALIATAEDLSKQYQNAISTGQEYNTKAATREVVIRQQAREDFKKTHQGQSWQEYSKNQIMSSDFMKDNAVNDYKRTAAAAEKIATTIESNIVRTNSLIRSASYWQNIQGVDTKRMTNEARRNQYALGKEVLSDLNSTSLVFSGKQPLHPLAGEEVHTYKSTYSEHEKIGAASDLKNEPEDLADTLSYIEGYNPKATMKQVITDQALSGKQMRPEMLTYLAEKSHETPGLMTAMTVDDVEKSVLRDAPAAGLSVRVVKDTVAKHSIDLTKTSVKELDSVKQNVQDEAQEQNRHKKYQRTLAAAAMELSTVNDHLSLDKVPKVSDNVKLLRRQMTSNKQAASTVGDVRNYVHDQAKKEGITDAIEKIEKFSKSRDEKVKSQLTAKQRADTKQEIDGGRRMGESRPGANSMLGH